MGKANIGMHTLLRLHHLLLYNTPCDTFRLALPSAQHHDRYVFGVQLWIGKISGSGMDCMFMGTIEPLPVPNNTAFAWVLGSGVLVSTDNVFSDWFAYRAEVRGAITWHSEDSRESNRWFAGGRGSHKRQW